MNGWIDSNHRHLVQISNLRSQISFIQARTNLPLLRRSLTVCSLKKKRLVHSSQRSPAIGARCVTREDFRMIFTELTEKARNRSSLFRAFLLSLPIEKSYGFTGAALAGAAGAAAGFLSELASPTLGAVRDPGSASKYGCSL